MRKLNAWDDPKREKVLRKKHRQILDALVYATKKKNLSLSKVSSAAGLSNRTFESAVENGLISMDTAILLADYLDMEIVLQEKDSDV